MLDDVQRDAGLQRDEREPVAHDVMDFPSQAQPLCFHLAALRLLLGRGLGASRTAYQAGDHRRYDDPTDLSSRLE